MNSITSLATNGVTEIWTLVLNFLLFIILVALLFFFASRAGKAAFIALITSLYVGFAVYTVFPYASLLHIGSGALNNFIASLVLYIVFVGISYYILRKNMGAGFLSMGNAGTIVLALLTAGFLIALSYHSFSLHSAYTLPSAIETYFAPAAYFFWWFIAPLVGLLVVAR